MIVYLASKTEFIEDVCSNRIEDRILTAFKQQFRHSVSPSELTSWRNSMGYMHRVLLDDGIPEDVGIAIEFNIPQTAKRIDFIVTGLNSENERAAVVIELKQWENAGATEKDGIVEVFLGGAEREVGHPSYQAWSYTALLEDFNEAVREEPIHLKPCAYLHNCKSGSTINSPFYSAHTEKAPAFLKADSDKLQAFIRQHVRHGDNGETIYRLQEGRIRPSKSLADSLSSLMRGNKEFLMIDEQKLVYETVVHLASRAVNVGKKSVLIVNGGPGTGKSVVAINLLVELTRLGNVAQYVTKNSAPRAVYESKLTGTLSKSRISNLFSGSGAFTATEPNTFDVLLIDEAHRLNEKSGMFQNLGENQIKEVISASRVAVFFIDEDQRVTFKDIGENAEILRWAKLLGAEVQEFELSSQFRCNGSDGFLAWVDDLLQIRETANPTLDGIAYEVLVCDSPRQLRELIIQKNSERNKARMVAGYCWDWVSKKKNPQAFDIVLPEHGFSARWNLASDGNFWIVKPEAVNEVGCIHTCQGLELDYVGVILGDDLIVRDGVVCCQPDKRASTDKSLSGMKKMFRHSRETARSRADSIIRNTYRTLMTRAQKGCFLYSVDAETNEYLKLRVTRQEVATQK